MKISGPRGPFESHSAAPEAWFHVVRPGTRFADGLDGALRDFLRSHGHSGPRKGARIEAWARALQAVVWSADPAFADRTRNAAGLQVVWLRCGNTTNAVLRSRLAPHLKEIEAAPEAGEALVEMR